MCTKHDFHHEVVKEKSQKNRWFWQWKFVSFGENETLQTIAISLRNKALFSVCYENAKKAVN